jgi:hypothetical protein
MLKPGVTICQNLKNVLFSSAPASQETSWKIDIYNFFRLALKMQKIRI